MQLESHAIVRLGLLEEMWKPVRKLISTIDRDGDEFGRLSDGLGTFTMVVSPLVFVSPGYVHLQAILCIFPGLAGNFLVRCNLSPFHTE